MSREGTAAEKAETAPAPDDPRKPRRPDDLAKPNWGYAMKKAISEFGRDQCTDLAAALTYYSVLSIFPALVALFSIIGLVGDPQTTEKTLLDLLNQVGASNSAKTLQPTIHQLVNSSGAGIGLVVGLLGAIWSASGYVGAFGRAMNKVYEVDEGRPFLKLRPVQLLVTVVLLLMAVVILIGLAVSGGVAEAIGNTIGLGATAVMVWNIAKWPVILLLVILMIAILYYATPNVRQPKFSWMSPGAAVALVVAILASVLFGFYVSNFGSYNKTYGSLAGVIVTLLWLWIINNVLLLGAELDAELERSRQLQAGIRAEEMIQLPPRDTSASEKAVEKREEQIARGRELRENAEYQPDDGMLDRAQEAREKGRLD